MTRVERLTALLAQARRQEEKANAQAVKERVAIRETIRVAYENQREAEVAAQVAAARALKTPDDHLSAALKKLSMAEMMIRQDSGAADYWEVRYHDGSSLGQAQAYHLRYVREQVARLMGWIPAPWAPQPTHEWHD